MTVSHILGYPRIGAQRELKKVTEAYWKGDKETLRDLCDESVYQGFAQAIDAREEAGETLDNRLIRIEDATIRDAELERKEARITVRFVADIAAVTHDRARARDGQRGRAEGRV